MNETESEFINKIIKEIINLHVTLQFIHNPKLNCQISNSNLELTKSKMSIVDN